VSDDDDTERSLRAQLQTVRRRATLVRDAALALTLETARDSEVDRLICRLQAALTDLRLALAEQAVREGTASEIASTHVEWPAQSTPEWPAAPREPRPWETRKH
jgi:hypothetical protein